MGGGTSSGRHAQTYNTVRRLANLCSGDRICRVGAPCPCSSVGLGSPAARRVGVFRGNAVRLEQALPTSPNSRRVMTSEALRAARALAVPNDEVALRHRQETGCSPGDLYLIAAEDIHAGQLVYDSPHGEQLKVIDLAMSDKVCALCGDVKLDSEEGGYLPQPCQCDECGAAAWCSPACRDKHAALHGLTCRFVRPLLRALRERHAGFVGGPEAYEPVEWTEGINLLTLLSSLCLRAQHLGLEGASTQTAVRSSLYTDILAMVSNLGLWPPGTRHQQLLGPWAA